MSFDWIKDWLHYDSVKGDLVWKKKPAKNIAVGAIAGSRNPAGYIRLRIDKQWFLAHRICWFLHYGNFPENQIDHIDGDPSNNAISNLRSVNCTGNARNQKQRVDNASGITGVCIDKRRGTWLSTISLDGKNHHLYSGKDFFEAVCRRRSAEIKNNFHENHGRVI